MNGEYVEVVIAEGDEEQLADIEPGEHVDFVGTLNGEEITVRFVRGQS